MSYDDIDFDVSNDPEHPGRCTVRLGNLTSYDIAEIAELFLKMQGKRRDISREAALIEEVKLAAKIFEKATGRRAPVTEHVSIPKSFRVCDACVTSDQCILRGTCGNTPLRGYPPESTR